MTEFGDSSINFVLRFWIRDPQNGLTNIRGTVLLSLWDKLKEADIAIPFPHREVIFRTPLEVASGTQQAVSSPQPRSTQAAKEDSGK